MRPRQLEMCTFQLAFHFGVHKISDFLSKLFVSRELMTESYQGRPMKCAHFSHFKLINRPLPGMVILWLI